MLECTTTSTELLYRQKQERINIKNEYKIDIWYEMRRRWMVFGVLTSVLLAAVAPRVGASGGPLHIQHLSHLVLFYVYFEAGRRTPVTGWFTAPTRLHALSVLHAHVVAPAICIITVTGFNDAGIDHRLVKGAIFSAVGGPCTWLSLSLCRCDSAAPILAINYLVSLVAGPLTMVLLCGRGSIPTLSTISRSLLTAVPFSLGALTPHKSSPSRLPALLLVYADCCQRLADAEGSLYVGDVLAVLVLEACIVVAEGLVCVLYAKAGLLSKQHAYVLALCAMPKALPYGWEWSTTCSPGGLSQLHAVFLAPTQSLLLSAVAADHYDEIPQSESNGQPHHHNGLRSINDVAS